MAEACTHDCSACGTTCGQDTRKQDLRIKPHALSSIKHTIAVVSGKGGVGKSLVTGLLSVAMNRKGKHVGILDADITDRLYRRCSAFRARCKEMKKASTRSSPIAALTSSA